jgi:hypothetical protein
MNSLRRKFFWLTAFSIAMGFMESAVVVYLRMIYYPAGFSFPLTPLEPSVAAVEVYREAATIIMLLAIGLLTGRNTSQKFAIFLFCFAVWDIFYYVFLKALLGWPASFLTWDILFLIPLPWVGPVICPCLVSLTMTVLSAAVIYYQEKGIEAHLNTKEWILMIMGSFAIILSFTDDFLKYFIHYSRGLQPSKTMMTAAIGSYVPSSFGWHIFIAGETLIIAAIILFVKRAEKSR